MIAVLSESKDFPCTDKGFIIRSRAYIEFADEIGKAYQKLGDSAEGSLKFDEIQLQHFLINLCREHFGLKLTSKYSDFYSAGLDSLMAIQLCAYLKGTIFLGHRSSDLTTNAIYNSGNTAELTKFLLGIQSPHKRGYRS